MIERCIPGAEISRRAHAHVQHHLAGKHREILSVLSALPDGQDLTASELSQRLPKSGAENPNHRARLLELRRFGRIVIAQIRACTITSRVCRAYRASVEGEIAPELPPEQTTKREAQLTIDVLRKKLAEANRRLDECVYKIRKAESDREDALELAADTLATIKELESANLRLRATVLELEHRLTGRVVMRMRPKRPMDPDREAA
jgi:DNA repair exonuclease SbcCD ATPase subunit